MQSYAAWLQGHLEQRARERASAAPGTLRFSILTTVYERTDPQLFRLTADCLTGQTLPFFEWIVLAHGPTTAALDRELAALDLHPDVRIERLPENLGIVGGMAFCLRLATGDYVVPMDADDLLTPDALQILAETAECSARPAFLYSDEDILIDGKPAAPYWRPDWDPILNLSSSFIWHLCCIRRDAAVEAALYSDSAANWCHDWDTVFRMLRAGHQPVHIPLILYHWRHHPVSSTNRADPDSGSRTSTHALLQSFIAGTARPHLYEIEDFPIFRGAPEWTVKRRPTPPAPVALATIGQGVRHAGLEGPWRASGPPDDATRAAPPPARAAWWRFWGGGEKRQESPATVGQMKRFLATTVEPLTLILSSAVEPIGEDWFWEAVKLFELHPDVALVHGLLVNEQGRVRRGGEVFLSDGTLVCPQAGKPMSDPGFFALALKPHSVAAAPTDFCLAETGLLRDLLARLPGNAPLAGLGIRLAAAARERDLRTAFSPLIVGRIIGRLADGDPAGLAQLARITLGAPQCETAGREIRGAAGFMNHIGEYR
ncbi:glycosyltransferase [Bosea sp. (in: a-proteobacteria)]|uniref:glycosyltransferase n=1 Tax=Bosea sp. (in: a-proteobacteria) TaxID=1871050 RepID=UPI003B3A1D6C